MFITVGNISDPPGLLITDRQEYTPHMHITPSLKVCGVFFSGGTPYQGVGNMC